MPDEPKKETDWVRVATIVIALAGWAIAAWQASKENKPIPPLPPVFLMAPAPQPAGTPPAGAPIQLIPMIPMEQPK